MLWWAFKLAVICALLAVWAGLAWLSFNFVQSLALTPPVAAMAIAALLFAVSFVVLYPALWLRARYRHRQDIRQLKKLLAEGEFDRAEALLKSRAQRAARDGE